MAQRATGNAGKKSPRKTGAGKTRAKSAAAGPGRKKAAKNIEKSAGSADIEAECTRLRQELAGAKAKIEMLEGRQAEVLNRLDWAIDSLQNVLDADN